MFLYLYVNQGKIVTNKTFNVFRKRTRVSDEGVCVSEDGSSREDEEERGENVGNLDLQQ